MQAKGLTPVDVVNAISAQNLILPSGTAKIGNLQYQVSMNGSPDTIAEINGLPVKTQNGATTYIRDVAHVRDGFSPQTNVVRKDGLRGTLITVMRNGGASTLDIVNNMKETLKRVEATLPAGCRYQAPVRSVAVRARFHQRGGARGADRGLPYGRHDFAFPGKLAQYADHCHFHSAIHSLLGHQPCGPGRDFQHHDPGRAGAGRRHPCG